MVPHFPSGRVTVVRVWGFQVETVIGSGVVWFLRILQATPHPEGQGVDSLEFGHHSVDRQSVNLRVVPAATVRGLFAATIPEHPHQFLVVAAGAGSIIESLVVANPEGDVPGLPVCPSVEGVGGHRGCSVWFLRILQGHRPPEGGQVDSLRIGCPAPAPAHRMR